jgi:hypothetical protein
VFGFPPVPLRFRGQAPYVNVSLSLRQRKYLILQGLNVRDPRVCVPSENLHHGSGCLCGPKSRNWSSRRRAGTDPHLPRARLAVRSSDRRFAGSRAAPLSRPARRPEWFAAGSRARLRDGAVRVKLPWHRMPIMRPSTGRAARPCRRPIVESNPEGIGNPRNLWFPSAAPGRAWHSRTGMV